MTTPVDCSVVIVTWQAWELLQSCLQSVVADTAGSGHTFEIIVVDNGSTDGTADRVAVHFPAARLLQIGRNSGYARAANAGMRMAGGRYILLMNNDVIVHAGALTTLLDMADRYGQGGMFAPYEVGPDGRSHMFLWRPGVTPGWGELVAQQLFPPELYRRIVLRLRRGVWQRRLRQEVIECGRTTGACVLVRRAALDSVGLLDEQFVWLLEDYDWAYRFHRRGWRIFVVPAARVTHLVGQSTSEDRRFLQSTRSKFVWYRKYFRRDLLPLYRALVIASGIPRLLYFLVSLARAGRVSAWPPMVGEWWAIVRAG